MAGTDWTIRRFPLTRLHYTDALTPVIKLCRDGRRQLYLWAGDDHDDRAVPLGLMEEHAMVQLHAELTRMLADRKDGDAPEDTSLSAADTG